MLVFLRHRIEHNTTTRSSFDALANATDDEISQNQMAWHNYDFSFERIRFPYDLTTS